MVLKSLCEKKKMCLYFWGIFLQWKIYFSSLVFQLLNSSPCPLFLLPNHTATPPWLFPLLFATHLLILPSPTVCSFHPYVWFLIPFVKKKINKKNPPSVCLLLLPHSSCSPSSFTWRQLPLPQSPFFSFLFFFSIFPCKPCPVMLWGIRRVGKSWKRFNERQLTPMAGRGSD